MPLVPGYNFVRGSASLAFQEAYRREYPGKPLRPISMIQFLRMVKHREAPELRCLQVNGFDQLWRVCEDDGVLAQRINQLLHEGANWVTEHLDEVYLVIPAQTEFVEGATFQLRLPTGEQVDIERSFGGPRQIERDEFNRPFSLS